MSGPSLTAAEVAELLRDSPARAGRTQVLAVDGRSGAGKTDLAGELARALGCPVVSLDDTYPGWDGLEAGVRRVLTGVLLPLATGSGPVTLPGWDWERDREGPPRQVAAPGRPPQRLVVEGVGCGARACAPYLSALVWLEAPDAVRHARAMARDGDLYRPHWQRWAEQEAAHFAREQTAARAGVVLDGTPAGSGGERRYLLVAGPRIRV